MPPPPFKGLCQLPCEGCEDFTAVYIDDILIFSETLEDHFRHLDQAFACLKSQSYHARLSKCKFVTTEVPFLGHVLTPEGISAAERRHEILKGFPVPFDNAKKVKSFLGMVMWYKSFIPHVATLAAPLFPLTSLRSNFSWSEEATQAVQALKTALTDTPVLARYDREKPTRVTTDASTVGIGAVLEQRHDETWRPVAFWSRKLKDAETRYSATDLEWLAVVDAVTRTWYYLLEDIPFTVRSDHAALWAVSLAKVRKILLPRLVKPGGLSD